MIAKIKGTPDEGRLATVVKRAIENTAKLESTGALRVLEFGCQEVLVKVRSGDLHYLTQSAE